MKKIVAMIAGVILVGTCVFIFGNNEANASIRVPPGVYQCAVCGVIVSIREGTVLDEKSLFDGHTHDWRYIGSGAGTIHPIK